MSIGWNDGSLVRRTLLHVSTFVLGSLAFVGLLSFALVSVARGLVDHGGGASADAAKDDAAEVTTAAPGAKKPDATKAPRAAKRKGAVADDGVRDKTEEVAP